MRYLRVVMLGLLAPEAARPNAFGTDYPIHATKRLIIPTG
jgi:hypothetical protein